MRQLIDLRMGTLLVLVFAVGCASSQTVRWRENPTDAATQVAELSATRTATIKTVEGGRIWARHIAFVGDSVRWSGSRDGVLHTMLLDDVASIEIVVGRHGGEGAWKGAIAGAVTLGSWIAIRCITDAVDCDESPGTGGFIVGYGMMGAAGGAIIGALFGTKNADKVIFVPQE